MIIGLCGEQGCGKDTATNILISEYGFIKLTFASTLKDVVAILFFLAKGFIRRFNRRIPIMARKCR